MEPPGGVDSRSLGPQDRRLRRPQSPPGRLQRAGSPPDDARRAAAAPAQPAGTAGPDPLPHLVLRGDLGFLPALPPSRVTARRRVRGLHRRLARGRLDDLGRVPAARRDRRRGPHLQPRLPPPARQRQPLRDRRRGPPGRGPGRGSRAPLQLPLPVRAGQHRRDRLAGPEPRPPGDLPPRADRRQPGRRRHLPLQAEPPRRPRDRPRGSRRPGRPRRGPRHRGLLPLRLRRAAVLLPRLRPARRRPDPHALGSLPRVPHLRRRPLVHRRGSPRRLARGLPGDRRRTGGRIGCAGAPAGGRRRRPEKRGPHRPGRSISPSTVRAHRRRPPLPQPRALRRTPARPPRPLRRPRRRRPQGLRDRDAVGAQPERRRALPGRHRGTLGVAAGRRRRGGRRAARGGLLLEELA